MAGLINRVARSAELNTGMQLDFVDDVARGAAALAPKVVLLYPPHDKFHEMMGAVSRPWTNFAAKVQDALPSANLIIAQPGTAIDLDTGEAAPDVVPVAKRRAGETAPAQFVSSGV